MTGSSASKDEDEFIADKRECLRFAAPDLRDRILAGLLAWQPSSLPQKLRELLLHRARQVPPESDNPDENCGNDDALNNATHDAAVRFEKGGGRQDDITLLVLDVL